MKNIVVRAGGFVPRALFAALSACLALSPNIGRAEDSHYCQKTRARASSEAALLFGPSVVIQGVKPPRQGDIDGSGVFRSRDLQLRAGVSVSPLDIYKGTVVLDVGDADCARQNAEEALRRALVYGAEAGKLPALKSQAARLDEVRPRLHRVVERAERRKEAQLATVWQLAEVRLKAGQIERKDAQVSSELARLEALALERPPAPLPDLVARYESTTMAMERRTTHLRNLAPWNVALRGGVIPGEKLDTFAMVELSYNFGGIARVSAEERYLEARQKELASSRSELREQARVLMRELDASIPALERELRVVDAQLQTLLEQRSRLAASDAPDKAQVEDLTEIELAALEVERAYLSTLLKERVAFRGVRRG